MFCTRNVKSLWSVRFIHYGSCVRESEQEQEQEQEHMNEKADFKSPRWARTNEQREQERTKNRESPLNMHENTLTRRRYARRSLSLYAISKWLSECLRIFLIHVTVVRLSLPLAAVVSGSFLHFHLSGAMCSSVYSFLAGLVVVLFGIFKATQAIH